MQHQLNLVNGISKKDLISISTAKGEGAFALDHDGLLLFINQEAQRLIGWDSPELLGKNFFEVVKFKVDAIATIGTSECAALKSVGCSHLHKGATMKCRDGSPLAIMFISMPVFDDGKMFGKAFVFREYKDSRVEEEMYRGIIENAGSAVIKLDANGKVIFTNQYARELFGSGIEANLPAKVLLGLQSDPEALASHSRLKKQCRTSSGRSITVSWTAQAIRGINNKIIGAICIGNDITDKSAAGQGNLRNQGLVPDKELTQTVLEHISDGVITIDRDGLVEYLNPIAEQLTGWACHEAKGQTLKDIFHVIDEKSREPIVNSVLSRTRNSRNNNFSSRCLLLRRDGWEFTIEESSSPIRDKQGAVIGAVVVFRDLTELQGLERWMLYETTHDTLTGLINRREFEARLNQAISSARTEGRQHALCYIDVDKYKSTHEKLGQRASEELLKQIASILHSKVRDTDILARIGEDEFAVLLMNCSVHNAFEATSEFCEAIRGSRFEWDDDNKLQMGISVGLVPITADCGGISDIISIADAACYVARDKGRNKIHVYQPHDVAVKHRQSELKWIQKIRQALDENRFRLFCQGIVPLNMPDAHSVHHEILIRMVDDEGSLIRPGSFIAAAERYNLMPSIDRWVVQNTLMLLKERISRNQQIGLFAINLSAQSLDDENFLNYVIDQLDNSNVPASHLCFEITETTAISNLMSATRFMSILRGMGCKFALDDFGRGFSSYGYLKNLHVDYLKIDGSFVRDLAHDPVDHAMVESINQIGHIMGVQTIAEFVENEETLEKLISLGVDHVQGYQLGRPRPLWHSFHSAAPNDNIQ